MTRRQIRLLRLREATKAERDKWEMKSRVGEYTRYAFLFWCLLQALYGGGKYLTREIAQGGWGLHEKNRIRTGRTR